MELTEKYIKAGYPYDIFFGRNYRIETLLKSILLKSNKTFFENTQGFVELSLRI